MSFTKLFAEIFRDNITAGNPSSGAHKPVKADIRAWGQAVEDRLGAASGVFNVPDALALSGFLTPTALSGDVNNYAPDGIATATVLRLDGGASGRNVTGIDGGAEGRVLIVHNIGTTNNITLVNQSNSSDAENRFLGLIDTILRPNQTATLRYDGVSARWRVVAAPVTATQLLDTISSTRGAILYRGANDWSGLAPGTSGQVLATQGAGADPQWAAASSGGLVLLTSGTVSSAATLDIVLTSYTSYRALKLFLSSFVPATDDVELWLRLSTNAGSSFDATGYSYVLITDHDSDTDAIDPARSAAANQILIAGYPFANLSVSNVAAEGGVDAEIDIHQQAASRWCRPRISSAWFTAAGASKTGIGTGSREVQQDTDALRVLFESGNIASGNWALYGYA
jgi:hypothetical protein